MDFIDQGQQYAPGCYECEECLAVCPAGAIKERQEDFEHLECFEQLNFIAQKLSNRVLRSVILVFFVYCQICKLISFLILSSVDTGNIILYKI